MARLTEIENKLRTTCRCLDCLISTRGNKDDKSASSQKELILKDLTYNVLKVLEAVKAEDQSLYETLNFYVVQTSYGDCWTFVMACLILFKSISESLCFLERSQREEKTGEVSGKQGDPEILSIKEQNIVRRAFQFLVALGILPNLMPGLRNMLKMRPNISSTLELIDGQVSPCLRYQRLVFCMSVISECLQERTLQRIFLSSHTSDFLLALFQICYAPIKKVEEEKDRKDKSFLNVNNEHLLQNQSSEYQYSDFKWHLRRLKVYGDLTEDEFITQMKKDREYFSFVLRNFIQDLSPSTLMWELLLLQNSRGSNDSKVKIPMWLKKKCNEMLTNKMLDPSGVQNFIQVTFDRMSDADVQSGSLTRHRVEAVARLITENSVQHMPLQKYVQCVLEQVLEIFHTKETSSNQVFMAVASSVVLQFFELGSEVVDRCLNHVFFNALWKCTSGHLLIFDGEKIVDEEEMTLCIEDTHKVFVACSSVLREDQVRVLLPFYHLLFKMYVKLLNGISFLRSRVQDLLKVLLKICSKDLSLQLLRIAAFENSPIHNVPLVTEIKCEFGDSGGIEIIKCSRQKTEYGDLAEDADSRCQALVQLLQEIEDAKLRIPFFLYLLKGTIQKNYMVEEQGSDSEITGFIHNLITVNLLENLTEIIGDDLVSNVDEAIEVVKGALECTVHCKDQVFSDEAIMNFLIILSTLLGYKDELSSAQWSSLKDCVPFLDALVAMQKDKVLKDIAADVSTAIKTHGAVLGKSNSSQEKVKTSRTSANNVSAKIVNPKSDNDCSVTSTAKLLEGIQIQNELPGSDANRSMSAKETGKKTVSYDLAMENLDDPSIPSRGHGLIALCQLIEKRDAETLSHKKELLEVFQKSLVEDDSYIYLSAIRGLSALGNVYTDEVLPILLTEFLNFSDKKWEQTLKVGESLLKVCQQLGDIAPKYRDKLVNAYLAGARHEDPQICASSLSNLGEVCKQVKFAIGPWLHEILFCVTSLLKSEAHIDVKRSATLVITLILRGTGVESLQVLQNEIKELYNLLRFVHYTAKDDILKLQAQLALEEVNHIVKETFSNKPPLVKEIRVLDPF